MLSHTMDRLPEERPGWQTDDLGEEWIDMDQDEEQESDESIPLAQVSGGRFEDHVQSPGRANKRHISSGVASLEDPATAWGTFVVREDQPVMDLHPGLEQLARGAGKNLFSPLALETMFEPPHSSSASGQSKSKPITAPVFAPSKLALQFGPDSTATETEIEEGHDALQKDDDTDPILETDMPNLGLFDGRKPSHNFQFTFQPPTMALTSTPAAQSPRTLGKTPLTDPKLKLFQLNYDTYTREHLSAIVDSIAEDTPSCSASPECETRNPKRLKLTPPQEFSPPSRLGVRKDYLGESESLMNAIRRNTRSVSLGLSDTEKSRTTARVVSDGMRTVTVHIIS